MDNTREEMKVLEKIIAESYNTSDIDRRYEKYIQMASTYISDAKSIKDYCLALSNAKKAVKYGYIEGYYILGQLYYYGTGCEQNLIRALKYFKIFVDKYVDRQFLNEESILDAYEKLAFGYYKLGHYDKALKYYHELIRINPEVSLDIDLENEIAAVHRENGLKYLKVAFSFLLLCSGILYCSTKYSEPIKQFFTPSESVVSVVSNEDVSTYTDYYEITDLAVATTDSIDEFLLVDEITFKQKDFDLIIPSNVWASSEYISSVGIDYGAICIVDMDEATAWQEGVDGGGIGECLHFDFPNKELIKAISILTGKTVTKDDFYNNNRVASFKILPYEGKETNTIKLEDSIERQYIIFNTPLEASALDIIIESIFKGNIFDDTCITELEFYK